MAFNVRTNWFSNKSLLVLLGLKKLILLIHIFDLLLHLLSITFIPKNLLDGWWILSFFSYPSFPFCWKVTHLILISLPIYCFYKSSLWYDLPCAGLVLGHAVVLVAELVGARQLLAGPEQPQAQSPQRLTSPAHGGPAA